MDTTDPPDFTAMDDSALIAWLENSRAELARLPLFTPGHAALSALLDQSVTELVERARKARARAS